MYCFGDDRRALSIGCNNKQVLRDRCLLLFRKSPSTTDRDKNCNITISMLKKTVADNMHARRTVVISFFFLHRGFNVWALVRFWGVNCRIRRVFPTVDIGGVLFFVGGFVFESPSSGSFSGGMLESVSPRNTTKQSRQDPAGHYYSSGTVSVQPLGVRRFFQGIQVQSRSWKSKCGAGGGR